MRTNWIKKYNKFDYDEFITRLTLNRYELRDRIDKSKSRFPNIIKRSEFKHTISKSL